MGVKHGRPYKDIMVELMDAIKLIGKFYEFFEMNSSEWEKLNEEEQSEVLEALADDVFYGLGTNSAMPVGNGLIIYDKDFHVLEVTIADETIRIIKLV
mgnify:CR=1 FL=1|jgi:hypothetical protein